ncbi:hypothetical protein [Snodgrassella communis]|uniref:hypothetical protein n=1 Tax=Snodgrassella communis TaxID=2946699 RepID=UPI001EF4A5D8|nr:hypothetical protein [Snodgrassella communis]
MKHHIKIILLIAISLGLTGCMEAAIDFWNGPGFSSAARDKASHECFEELESLPEPENKSRGSKEMQEWLIKVYTPASVECMKRKGF